MSGRHPHFHAGAVALGRDIRLQAGLSESCSDERLGRYSVDLGNLPALEIALLDVPGFLGQYRPEMEFDRIDLRPLVGVGLEEAADAVLGLEQASPPSSPLR